MKGLINNPSNIQVPQPVITVLPIYTPLGTPYTKGYANL